ncbi:MAG: hypothetical protein ACR2O6_06850 [Ilumatobacteraceae bacterium]
MLRKLRLPLLVWVVTSVALIALAAQVNSGVALAAVYVGANAIGTGIVLSRRPPYSDRALEVAAWCAAAQLPVMFVPLFDSELTKPGGRRKNDDDAQQGRGRVDERPGRRPGSNGASDLGGGSSDQ